MGPEMGKPATVLAMSPGNVDRLFDSALAERLKAVAAVDLDLVVNGSAGLAEASAEPAVTEALASADVLLTSWGAPLLDEAALARMPRLRAVVHAAGSVKGFVTDAVWQRGIVVSSAVAANAVPVAEYTLAMILLAGKRALPIAAAYADGARRTPGYEVDPAVGNHGRRVGIVGASRVGRRVIELLAPFDLEVLVSDPTIGAEDAARLGVRLVELDDLVSTCDVVSIHAPDVPATRHLFDARRLGRMRDGATLINTARGRLVDTAALTAELTSGRLYAVLDVTDPEPLPADSPLFGLPNVTVTPHIAGSLGNEVRRMGQLAVAELERFAAGQPFAHPVRAERWSILA